MALPEREPKGVLDGALLPTGAKIGSVLKADAEVELDGMTILAVTTTKEKAEKSGLLDLIPSDKPFEGVTQQLASERSDRPPPRWAEWRSQAASRQRPAPRREALRRAPIVLPVTDLVATVGWKHPARSWTRPERRNRPSFTAPPELRSDRSRSGSSPAAHRNAVLADLPEEQRPVAERALQGGLPAVRQAVNEQNVRLKAEGKPEVPAAGLLSMAEGLLRDRVAEWLDRAGAAMADIDELDLRDLRSVVAAGETRWSPGMNRPGPSRLS